MTSKLGTPPPKPGERTQDVSALHRRVTTLLVVLLGIWFFLPVPGAPRRALEVVAPPVAVGSASLVVSVRAVVPVPCTKRGDDGELECQEEREEVAAGAELKLFRRDDATYVQVGRGLTDARGHARFDELVPGAYWMLADAKGQARRSRQVVVSEGSRTIRLRLLPASRLQVVVVDESEAPLERVTVLVNTRDPLPFGGLTGKDGNVVFDRLGPEPWEVHAQAPGYETAVQKKVFGDTRLVLRRLSGILAKVVDPAGKPVSGAQVLVSGISVYPPRRTETDATGTATLAGLGHGAFELKASKGSLVSRTQMSVQLAPGELRRVTLVLELGRHVEVRVVEDATEPPVPVAAADVVLVEYGIGPFPIFGRTGSDGRVTLGPIPAGPAAVTASAKGFISRNAVPVPEDLSGPLVVRLFRGGTIVGKVVDTDDRPIAGASLEVVGMDIDGLPIVETPTTTAFRRGHFAWALQGPAPLIPVGELGVTTGPIPAIPTAGFDERLDRGFRGELDLEKPEAVGGWVTAHDGRFTAHPVPPGRVRVLARHPEYVEGVSDVVELGPGGEAEVKVVLSAGAAIEGRVLDEAGIPVAGARVDVSALRGTAQRSVYTATDGTFAFAALPEEVMLSLARPDDVFRMIVRRQLTLTLGETTEVELVLPEPRPGVTVVVSDADSPAVDAVQVSLSSLEPLVPLRQTRFTDQLGEALFEDALGLHVMVEARAPGYAPLQQVVHELPERLELTLERGILVAGIVQVDRGLESLGGASVTLLSRGERHHTETSDDGRFQILDVRPGPAKITVRHPNFAPLDVNVVIEETGRRDRAFDVEPIVLEQPGGISGVVVDEEGNPVRGARVAVGIVPAFLPSGDLPSGMARTDQDGRFQLTRVQPGAVDVEAYLPDRGRGVAAAVDVQPGETTGDVKIVLLPSDEAPALDAGGGGVAVTLGERGEGADIEVFIVHVAEGSEAERSGAQVGDRVVAVDGATAGSMNDVRARLNGKVGQDVVVSVERGGAGGAEVRLRIRRERVRR